MPKSKKVPDLGNEPIKFNSECDFHPAPKKQRISKFLNDLKKKNLTKTDD